MATLPQLLEEDIQRLDDELRELLEKSDATTAMVCDKGGFLLTSQGDNRRFDLTTIAALASGAFMANQTIANLIDEPNFNSVYQQGDSFSMYCVCIDDYSLLVVVFRATVSVGVVKYFATPAVQAIARQMLIAQQRDPSGGLDLSVLNMADASDLFKRRA
jgi:predicted regulator of Ras-like GTPase activity (Roadblock/LC7/MglB family)